MGEERVTQDLPGETFNPTTLLRLLRVRWRLIASVALLLLVITTIITLTLTPRYTAEAIVTLDQRKNNVTDANAIVSGLTGDAATVQVQIQILQSRSLLAQVIDKQHLENDPAFNRVSQGASNFESLRGHPIFEWLVDLSTPFKKPVTIKTPGEEAQDVKNEILDNLLDGLTVSTVGFSQAIEIKFRSENAQQAARIANAIADAYIEDQLNAKLEATKNARKYLSDRLNELSSQVKTAEAAVTRYRADNDLMDAGEGISSVDQQITALNTQLVTAQSSLAEQVAKVGRIRALRRAARNVDVTQVTDSPFINQLRAEESALLRQEAEFSSRYGPRHPKMIDLESQKANLERKIQDEVRRIGQAVSNDADIARAKLRSLQQSLDGLNERAATRNQSLVTLKQLEQDAASSHSLYDAFLAQFKEIEDREEIQRPDARILSSASVPKAPSFPPSKVLIFGAAIPASLFLGFMAALFSELLVVKGFRTSAQLEHSLALRVLATAPEVRGRRARSSLSSIVSDNPVSPFAESMRGIQYGLTSSDVDHPPKVILVTSAIPQEGKSTVALSLARTVARNGKKVVLMGCDFRRPQLLRMVGAGEVKKGLVGALLGGESVENCFHKDPSSEVLLLAPETTVRNPSDLLGSVEMENLIRDLRGSADCIIIDSPPLLPVNDTKLLIRLIDTMLLIVRWEKTPRDAAIAAVRSLLDLRAPIAGVVITRADSDDSYNYGFQNYLSYPDEVLLVSGARKFRPLLVSALLIAAGVAATSWFTLDRNSHSTVSEEELLPRTNALADWKSKVNARRYPGTIARVDLQPPIVLTLIEPVFLQEVQISHPKVAAKGSSVTNKRRIGRPPITRRRANEPGPSLSAASAAAAVLDHPPRPPRTALLKTAS